MGGRKNGRVFPEVLKLLFFCYFGKGFLPIVKLSGMVNLPITNSYLSVACQVLEWLVTDPQGVYVDCTLGGGGHSAALLEALEERGLVVGLDRDPDALREASRRLSREVRRKGWCHTI